MVRSGDDSAPSDRPVPLQPRQAHEAIQHLLESRAVTVTDRCMRQGQQRHFGQFDVLNVLERGTVSSVVGWDDKRGDWIYRVSSRDLDGDPLTTKVVIDLARRQVRVVTAHE